MSNNDGAIPFKRNPDQNIMLRLSARQVHIDTPAQMFHRERAFYQCLVPNHTEANVQMPQCYLRKFTPDGKKLLAFSSNQRNVMVYDYAGACAGQALYLNGDENVKAKLFDCFFKPTFSILVAHNGENLNRECNLFTSESRYAIVASSAQVEDANNMYDLFQNNESISNPRSFPENYTFYTVGLMSGMVKDFYALKCDKIILSHNQGLSLCNKILAVFSVQNQTIHLLRVEDGIFIHLQDIGRFCYPDDGIMHLQNQTLDVVGIESTDYSHQPFFEKWYCTLKHRLLCKLLHKASASSYSCFCERYEYYSSLKLWKMQLIDEKHLLLKFATEEIVMQKQNDPTSQPAFFAVYDIESTEFLAVYENSSEEFLKIYEHNADNFRAAVSHPLSQHTSSLANNLAAKALHMKFKWTITNAKYGGRREAVRRLLGQLPICSQSYSSSPYLDLALFRYDDKWISALERPKHCMEGPVKFFTRDSSVFSFELQTKLPPSLITSPSTPSRRLVAYIFHPYEPFIISIQRAAVDYVVSFHFRNCFRSEANE